MPEATGSPASAFRIAAAFEEAPSVSGASILKAMRARRTGSKFRMSVVAEWGSGSAAGGSAADEVVLELPEACLEVRLLARRMRLELSELGNQLDLPLRQLAAAAKRFASQSRNRA